MLDSHNLPPLDDLAAIAGGVFATKVNWEPYRTGDEDPRFAPLIMYGNKLNYLEALRTSPTVLPSIPDIHFSFVDSPGVNAKAGPTSITVNLGTHFVLRYLFHRCLARPNVLKDVLPNDQEKAPELIAQFPSSVYECIDPQASPMSRDRLIAANSMIDFAFSFLTAHEFAHIRNGHLGFVQRYLKSERNSLSEQARSLSMVEKNSEQGARWLRALEYDADCYAINRIMLRVFNGQDNLSEFPGVLATRFEEIGVRLQLYAFAIHVLYRICWAKNPFTLVNPSHPTPPVRAALFHATSASWMMTQSPEISEHVAKYMESTMAGLVEAELAMDLIIGEVGSHTSSFQPLLVNEMMAPIQGRNTELQALETDWRAIRDRVAPYCHCSNLP